MPNFIRRYWGIALVLVMVGTHAAVIGYVRSRIAQMSIGDTATVEVGQFRFQNADDFSHVYTFRLHAVIDPSKLYQGRNRLSQMRVQIHEDGEQLLRQVDSTWLNDPTHTQIRERLMAVVLQYLEEPVIERVLITDWLKLPSNAPLPMAPPVALASKRDAGF